MEMVGCCLAGQSSRPPWLRALHLQNTEGFRAKPKMNKTHVTNFEIRKGNLLEMETKKQRMSRGTKPSSIFILLELSVNFKPARIKR